MSQSTDRQIEALWNAVKEGDASQIRLLVAKGVDVNVRNRDGWTPLHIAAQYGHADAMRALIAAKSMQTMAKAGMDLRDAPTTWNEQVQQNQESATAA